MLSTIIGQLPPTQKVPIIAILGLAAIASVLLFFLRSPTLSSDRALLGLAITWIGLVPGFLYLAQPSDARTPVPVMPVCGLFYSVFFGFSVFLVDFLRRPQFELVRVPHAGNIHVYRQQLEDISLEALTLTLIGILLMFLSWSTSKRLLWRRIPHIRLPDRFAIARLRLLYWGLAVASLAYVVNPWLRTLPSIGQFLQPAAFLAFAGFYVLWKRGQLPGWQAAAYFLCVLPAWALNITAGTLMTPLILLFVIWASSYLQLRDRIPWRAISGIFLAFLILYPASGTYRGRIQLYLHGVGGPPNLASPAEPSFVEKIAIMFRSVGDVYSKPENYSTGQLISGPRESNFFFGLNTRISFIVPLSLVVERTPDPIPFWRGETYKPLITSWIPRALWPGKPEEKTGNAFARRYAFNKVTDPPLSVNLPWITEMYANFGRVGVIAGMFLIGLLFGALEKILNEAGMAPVEWVIGAIVLIPLAFQESNFSVMTGSVLPLVICLWIYFTVGLRLPFPRFLDRFL